MKREPKVYPPGWFSEPVFAWWPNFRSAITPGMSEGKAKALVAATAAGAAVRATGQGWGNGTMPHLQKPLLKEGA